ncbi:MAG: DUF488 family protein [Proteobacteria bacterium]|nr:DUF488 family protein [Pseudomonadota bacterium]
MGSRRQYASPACLLGQAEGARPGAPLRIQIKRVYEAPQRKDGFRVLVDRLWPRGVSREAAHLDAWAKELAPSTALRRWFGHDPAKQAEFVRRYRRELKAYPGELDGLRQHARQRPLTLLYAARDSAHTHARVLQQVLEEL